MDSYKQCPNCGKTFPAQDAFCDDCGCQLDWMPSTQPQQSFMPPPTQTTTAYYAEKPKKTGTLIVKCSPFVRQCGIIEIYQ